MWQVRTLEVAGQEPVTLDEAKEQCNVDSDDWDILLTRLISVARELVEDRTGQLLREQTIEIIYDGFSDPIRLPRSPLTAVSALTYGEAEAAVTGYRFATRLGIPTLRPALNASWPYTVEPIVITATGGYEPGEVPQRLRHAILLQVADWFRQRETFVDSGAMPAPMNNVDALINDYRLSWL